MMTFSMPEGLPSSHVVKEWEKYGILCVVAWVREHYVGYVGIPKEKEKELDTSRLSLYMNNKSKIRELTYGNEGDGKLGRREDYYWWGFDTAHSRDKNKFMGMIFSAPYGNVNCRYFDKEKVIEWTESMARVLSRAVGKLDGYRS